MTPRPYVAWFGAVLTAICVALLAPTASAETRSVDLTLLLVNDMDQMSGKDDRGGVARVASVVATERSERDNVLFFHAGDAISPSILSGFDQGAHMIDLLNMLDIAAFSPGNHEFDFGPDVFATRMAEATFPILAANLRDESGAALPGIDDHLVIHVDGVKLGVVGLVTADTPITSAPGNLQFSNPVETLTQSAQALRDEGTDIVIALAHVGTGDDLLIQLQGLADLTLSGHDHVLTLIYDGDVVLAEAKEEGEYVIAIDLVVTIEEGEDGREVSWHPSFRILDTADYAPKPDVAAKVASLEAQLSEELDVVIGKTATELDSRRPTVRGGEAAIGNLIADAMRAAVDADIGLTNGGGIRADRIYQPGTDITRRAVLEELPFGNRTVLLEVTGAQLKQALENAYGQIDARAGRFAHVSGMSVVVGRSAPQGERVSKIRVGEAPVDPDATYLLATNNFVADGGDGYAVFQDAKVIIDAAAGSLMASDVMAYIEAAGTIAPEVEGRIVFR